MIAQIIVRRRDRLTGDNSVGGLFEHLIEEFQSHEKQDTHPIAPAGGDRGGMLAIS